MNKKKQLTEAIDYVIQEGYSIFDRAIRLKKRLEEANKICLYGTGNFFENYSMHIKRYDCVCDKNPNKWGKDFNGRKCLSVSEIKEIEDVIVIIMIGDYQEVQRELDLLKIENYYFGDIFLNIYDEKYTAKMFSDWKKQIIDTIDLFEDEQSKEIYANAICNRIAPQYAEKTFHDMEQKGEYFDTGVFSIGDNESFVDVGAYDGDSIVAFLEKTNFKYSKIWGFELDPQNYAKICENGIIKQCSNVEVFNYGVSNESATIKISQNGTGSRVDGNGNVEIKLIALDECIKEAVSFIKIDVEGEEINVLDGAKMLIGCYVPKLAVSVYHKLNHLWEIPRLIKKMNPDYKLFLRHHTAVVWDTNCYAYAPERE